MKKIEKFWLCKSDQWVIIPTVTVALERLDDSNVLSFTIMFLNRWCAVEFWFAKGKEATNG
jgi:hypothetical protein